MLRKIFALFFVLVGISFANFQASKLEFKPEKESFKKSEKVCFYLKNNSTDIIYLPSSAPWAVFSDKKFENVIYSPVATQSIIKLRPSETKKWCWKQKDFKNQHVPSGEYTVRITVFEKGKKIFLSSTFKIENSQ